MILTLSAANAFATNPFAGRQTSTTPNWDGSSARVVGKDFSPGEFGCQVVSVAVTANNNPSQLEVGAVSCGASAVIDQGTGSCGGQALLTEVESSGVYHCYKHGSYVSGTGVNVKVVRNSASGGCFTSYINGNAQEQACNLSNVIHSAVAEESDGSSSCFGWGISASVSDFEGYQYSTGWANINPDKVNVPQSAPCFAVSDTSGTNRVFTIIH